MNGYELSRNWFDFCFENPDKIKPSHAAVYFFAIEHCNRLGWKEKFGLPTSMVLEAVGIKSYSVYKKTFDDLVEWGFVEVVEYSKNQYSSNIIALKENCKAHSKALDKALINHSSKQVQSTSQSTESIDKQQTSNLLTIETSNQERFPFEDFWNLYDKKVGRPKSEKHWNKLNQANRELIMNHIPLYKIAQPEKKFRKNPITYFNNQSWLDELITNTSTNGTGNQPTDATTRNRADSEASTERILAKLRADQQLNGETEEPEGPIDIPFESSEDQ